MSNIQKRAPTDAHNYRGQNIGMTRNANWTSPTNKLPDNSGTHNKTSRGQQLYRNTTNPAVAGTSTKIPPTQQLRNQLTATTERGGLERGEKQFIFATHCWGG
ncbi:hypothetical protein AVEN_9985-1 [Araneus ventricosus]|uniref:Uncharacterized protein n=1 Tax=Araneus ventricosus TaxID=182803 RepID=A0A4Y2FBS5_ARAVE|nr:hypothetical protein AVEN_9985-1 [Araneus ventricosus]